MAEVFLWQWRDLVWERIEAWLREHQCTSALSSLHPPASEEAVQSLQDAVAYPLHPDLLQWLSVHGGAPLCRAPVWADPLWLPVAGTHTGESLLIDHRPGDTYGSVIEIDYEGNEVTAVRWRSLGEMVRLMAESLESGLPMPYSHQYVRVPRLDEGPPRSLDWKLEKVENLG